MRTRKGVQKRTLRVSKKIVSLFLHNSNKIRLIFTNQREKKLLLIFRNFSLSLEIDSDILFIKSCGFIYICCWPSQKKIPTQFFYGPVLVYHIYRYDIGLLERRQLIFPQKAACQSKQLSFQFSHNYFPSKIKCFGKNSRNKSAGNLLRPITYKLF